MTRRTVPFAIVFATLALALAYALAGSGASGGDVAYAARPPTKTPAPTATPTPIPPTPTPSAACTQYPGQILNLTNWKLTLPVDSSGGTSGSAAEILQPQLATYCNDPYFVVSGSGVRFRAPVNGATTSGSSYPRSELREMTNNGSALASWSTTSGTHTMYVREAITHLPAVKNQTMAGQIHDGSTKVIDVRLSGSTLYLELADGTHAMNLTTSYVLGTIFTYKFVAGGGKIDVYYNDGPTPVYTLTINSSSDYFKAGAYPQSNCSYETDCSANNYGEVIVYQVDVTHQ